MLKRLLTVEERKFTGKLIPYWDYESSNTSIMDVAKDIAYEEILADLGSHWKADPQRKISDLKGVYTS